jgi:RNA-directed DNA polymerase
MTNAISSNTKRKVKYPESTHWSEINWRKVERKVYKLQKRIYKATQVWQTERD